MTIYGLLTFCAVYALAVAAPGPGIAAIIARGLAHGMKGAPAFIAGFMVGDLVWFAIAATGLAALARTAATLFVAIKWAGVAYLLYPGVQAVDCAGEARRSASPTNAGSMAGTHSSPA